CSCYGGRGFESNFEMDLFPVADATEDTSLRKFVVLRSAHCRSLKATTDLESFGRINAQHRLGQIGFQFIEDRFSQASRGALNNAAHHSTNTIALGTDLFDQSGHGFCSSGISATHWIVPNRYEVELC